VALSVFFISVLFIGHEEHQMQLTEQLRLQSQLKVLKADFEKEVESTLTAVKGFKSALLSHQTLEDEEVKLLMQDLLKVSDSISTVVVTEHLEPLWSAPDVQAFQRAQSILNNPTQFALIKSAFERLKPEVLLPPSHRATKPDEVYLIYPFFNERTEKPGLVFLTLGIRTFRSLIEDSALELNSLIAMGEYVGPEQSPVAFLGNPLAVKDSAVIEPLSVFGTQWFLAASSLSESQTQVQRRWFLWLMSFLVTAVFGGLAYWLIAIYNDKVKAIHTANYRANFDALTSLPNRYHFSQRLSGLITEMKREEQEFAMFFIDIDHFKQINDTSGHSVGDELLIQFSQRLRQSARDSDIVARLAGDEFIVVLRNISDVIQADLLAEKMQKRLSQPFFIGSRQYLMTASMGIALFPMDGDNAETLLQHADQAMYAAKDSGRNGYFFFNEDMQEQAEYFLDVHNDILKGLERNEFFLEYQPILSLKDNLIHHCEALLRWNHPTKGLLYPDYFISVAERTGAIRALGNWVLSQACKDIRTFTEEGVDLQISINRSVSEFHSSQSLESWKGIFKVNGVSPDRIIFEITESLFMDEHPSRVNVVNALQKMGVQFAIDDFGTGYSALNYLRSYPAQYLKIDKSFISDLLIDDQDRTLVEVIIKMGMTLGIHVIAEGVENDDQVQTLKAFGCEYVQGFWLAKAMPLDRVIAFCQSSNSVPTPPHSLTLK
jgi:diguanylate cyclase (GGDEF)-like protein